MQRCKYQITAHVDICKYFRKQKFEPVYHIQCAFVYDFYGRTESCIIFKNPAYVHLKIRVYRYILSGRLCYCNFLDPKRSTLVTGSIPSENLPSRVHDVPDPAPRRPIVRVVESESKRTKHSSLKSIVGNLKRMVLGQWKFEEQESLVKLHLFDNKHVLPKFEVVIYSSLKFRVFHVVGTLF